MTFTDKVAFAACENNDQTLIYTVYIFFKDLPFPKQQILDSSILKELADDNF